MNAAPEVDEKTAARIAALKTLQPGDIIVGQHENGCRSIRVVGLVRDRSVDISVDVLTRPNGALHSLTLQTAYNFDYLTSQGLRIHRTAEGVL